jgi:hypothetical protein
MVKKRVAPTTALLEDVVRDPRPASLEALPWWHLFALSHFLEGVQGQCLRQNPRRAMPLARRFRAPGVAFSPLLGGGTEGLSPLRGGKLAREGVSPSREKVAY